LKKPHPLALLAGFFFGLDIAFWHLSLVKTSVANATFIVNLGNVAVGLIAWIALKQRPAKIWPLAVAIALAGAFMLSRGAAALTQGAIEGDLLALLAGAMVGLYLFFAMLARRDADGMNVLFWSTATTLAVSLAAAVVAKENLVPLDPFWLVMPLLLAIIAHVAGQGLIVAGVGGTPAALAGILLLLQPVAGAAVAWPLFGEKLTPTQLAGAALVLAGVWLAGRRR
jgi:drug/metabolite transporter (DMT)-like permease